MEETENNTNSKPQFYNFRCVECGEFTTRQIDNEDIAKEFDGSTHKDCISNGKWKYIGNNNIVVKIIRKIRESKDRGRTKKEIDKEISGNLDDQIAMAWKFIKENDKENKKSKEDKTKSIYEYDTDSINTFKQIDDTYKTTIGNKEQINEIKEFHVDRRYMEVKGKLFHKGIILHGPPGTGKDTTVRAMIKEELNQDTDVVIPLWADDVISGDMKESAQNVRRLGSKCRDIRDKLGKAVHVIITEAEKKIASRKSSSHNQAVLGMSWAEVIDGFVKLGPKIYFYILANDISNFDEAMTRHGRISKTIGFELPGNEARIEAFKEILIPKLNGNKDLIDTLVLEELSKITEGYSIALIASVSMDLDAMQGRMTLTKDIIYNKFQDEIDKYNELHETKIEKSENDDICELVIAFVKEQRKNDKHGWEGTSDEFRLILYDVNKSRTNAIVDINKFYKKESIGIRLGYIESKLKKDNITYRKTSSGKNRGYSFTF